MLLETRAPASYGAGTGRPSDSIFRSLAAGSPSCLETTLVPNDASNPTESNARTERDETDASLRAERSKTDSELAKTTALIEGDADQVVELARERADAILQAARERTDREMTMAAVTTKVRHEVEAERATEDETVAEEELVADERLQVERKEKQRAHSALLRHERAATDDGLLVERARADEVVSTRDDFLGMVSHDLRGMLSGISLTAALLVKQSGAGSGNSAVTVKHAERIQRFAGRMSRLVGDLLDVVSLEAGKLHVTLSPVNVSQLLNEAMEAFAPSFSAKAITLAKDLPAGELMVMGDHERILQVLANILDNALKFTAQGGRVLMAVARVESEVRFSITDTGEGLPPGHETTIFERFRQVRVRRKDRPGLGLGLYIAKSIVDAHDGRIWVERPGAEGTAFHFTIPLVPPAPAAASDREGGVSSEA
jgi:signal transduction histidine kinase